MGMIRYRAPQSLRERLEETEGVDTSKFGKVKCLPIEFFDQQYVDMPWSDGGWNALNGRVWIG